MFAICRLIILLLCVFFNFVEPYSWCKHRSNICTHRHREYNHRYDDKPFEEISKNVIDADLKAKSLCTENQEIAVKEVYESEFYRLIIKLPRFDKDKFDIRIKHRVIYVKTKRSSDSKTYKYIKILSDFLNYQSARWYFGDDELTIEIPYKKALRVEANVTCKTEINDGVIKVPLFEDGPTLIDPRNFVDGLYVSE